MLNPQAPEVTTSPALAPAPGTTPQPSEVIAAPKSTQASTAPAPAAPTPVPTAVIATPKPAPKTVASTVPQVAAPVSASQATWNSAEFGTPNNTPLTAQQKQWNSSLALSKAASSAPQTSAFGISTPSKSATPTGSGTGAFGITYKAPPAPMTAQQLIADAGTGPGGVFNAMTTQQANALMTQQSPTAGIMNGGPVDNGTLALQAKRSPSSINWSKALPGAQAFDASAAGKSITGDLQSGNYTQAFQTAAASGGLNYMLHGATIASLGGGAVKTKAQYDAFYAAAAPYIAKIAGQASYGTGHGASVNTGDLSTVWGQDTSKSADANFASASTNPLDLATYASNDKAYEAENRNDNIGLGEFALSAAGMFLTAGGASAALGAAVGAGTGAGGAAAGGAIIGAGEGAAGSELSGGNPLTGALTGAVGGATSGYMNSGGAQEISDATGGLLTPTTAKMGASILKGGVTGGVQGAIQGGISSGASAALGSLSSGVSNGLGLGSVDNSPGSLMNTLKQIGGVAVPTLAGGLPTASGHNTASATAAEAGYPALTPQSATVTPLQQHLMQRKAAAVTAQQQAVARAARARRYA